MTQQVYAALLKMRVSPSDRKRGCLLLQRGDEQLGQGNEVMERQKERSPASDNQSLTAKGDRERGRFSSGLAVVEMGESRTPRPGKPVKGYPTGLVGVLPIRRGLPPTGFLSAGHLVLDVD